MDAHEFNSAAWIRSSYSDRDGGNCVEVAPGIPRVVPVRDSKVPHGPAIAFPQAGWASFLAAVKSGALTTWTT
ncbi:DUF397 domain-containing protein [Streptomyces sp. CT34]|uniref:DUF397 domain-containing protein n=1 Tax=Streptomyces sp. CT34 TaxID=1553907 RepID=UPI0005B7F3D6|nr:DUF397 domain-containing protein [Streptomyces sp. CT34]